MKKTVFSAVVMMLSYAGITISGIWTIVEFIIYLVKDHQFNWWSLWTLIISICTLIVSMVATLIFAALQKKNASSFPTSDTRPHFVKKSKFQLRLEEMEKQKNKYKNPNQ